MEPLRILQVGSGFPGWGGTELHLVNLGEQLVLRGHHVTVSARPDGFVEAEARKRGLATAPVTVRRQWDFADRNALRDLLARERFDVVHVHWSTDYAVTPLLARRAGVPAVVMSRHSPYPLKSALGRYLYDRVLFDRVIALSESVRRTLIAPKTGNQRAEKVVTIHHGTDTEAFRQTTLSTDAVRAEWGIPAGRFVVGLVGRIAPEKGYAVFLDAVAQAIKAGANVHAVIVGDGPDAAVAKERAARPDLAGRVTFGGFRSDVNNAMNALDVFVLASTWAEPCAAVVQQAMALSKPVIGTDTGGTPEMVAAGETGLLVAPGDAVALADALGSLYALPESDRARMGNAGRTRVDRLFTLSGMTDRNEALYRDIIGAKAVSKVPPRRP